MAAVLEAPTLLDSLALFARSILDALVTIVHDSYLSMLVLAGLFMFFHGFACGGGVGCLGDQQGGGHGHGQEGKRWHPSQVC